MRQYGTKDGEESLKRESLGTEEFARYLSMFGGAMRRECCTAASLPPLGNGGLGEGGYVMAWWIVGGEVGGHEKKARIVWKCTCIRFVKISGCTWSATHGKAYIL